MKSDGIYDRGYGVKPGMYVDPAQVPMTLMEPSMEAGQPPERGRYCCLYPDCEHAREQVFNGGGGQP